MNKKISLDLITNIIEIIGAAFVVAGIGVLLGTGACLVASGLAILTLSYFASLGNGG
jgi:hypothetical protein